MPVYAYTCRDCGTPLEVHQEFSDAALTVCPVCGGRLRKQYGSIGVTFNGSGFYRTDSSASEGSKGDGGSKSEGGGSGGGEKSNAAKADAPKTESKPAASKPAASSSPSSAGGSS